MNPTPRFCTNCGNPLTPAARFCGHCGAAIAPQPQVPAQPSYPVPQPPPAQAPQYPPPGYQAPQYPPPVAQAMETTLGFIPGATRRSGPLGLKMIAYTIVVTHARLIFAELTGKVQQESAQQAKEQAKAQGKGFFGQWGAVIGSGSGQRYLQMHPQAILDETPGNFFLFNNQVLSARVWSSSDADDNTTYYLEIKTAADKLKFEFQSLDERGVRELLRSTLGGIVK